MLGRPHLRERPRLVKGDDPELYVLQEPEVHYRGQIVALVVADTLENAREAAARVAVEVAPTPHRVILDAADPNAYVPETANAGFPGVAEQGDPVGELARAAVRVDHVYTTPAEHNNAMEPHASLAIWDGDDLTVYDSNQGSATARDTLAKTLDVDPGSVRVVNRHVGGGFGSKGTPRPQLVLAAIAARAVGRPVKLAITRQQMFAFIGYRTPTVQRVALGADADGRLVAITHDAIKQTSRTREFTEQTVVATRTCTRAEHRRTRHRLVAARRPDAVVDARARRVPGHVRAWSARWTSWRSPPASTRSSCGSATSPRPTPRRAPVQLAQPRRLPARGRASASAGPDRDPRRACAATAPGWSAPASPPRPTRPTARRPRRARDARGRHVHVQIAAADIGTGARTALTQIAADALEAPVDRVGLELGDSGAAEAPAGGRVDGHGVVGHGDRHGRARRCARTSDDATRPEGFAGTAATTSPPRSRFSRHAFGAQFGEVARERRHRRGARRRACSACSPRAGSSTRSPRARSSSAA